MIPKEINLGPLTIHFYGIIIALAIYAGYILAKNRARLYKQSLRSSPARRGAGLKISPKFFDDPLLILPLVLSIIGARLYHVFDYWTIYNQNPISILFIQNGGLGIWGAIAGLMLGFYIFARVKKLNFLVVLDIVAPSLLLGQSLGRIGNYINQEGFGPPTDLPWGVYINSENRPPQYLNRSHFHPTFFYEAILDGIFFVILLYLAQKLKIRGQVFALYLILYSVGRFIVEFWRIDTATIGPIKIAQVLAVVAIFVGMVLFVKTLKTRISSTE